MPRTNSIVPGVEFALPSVSNGDGTYLDVWATVQGNDRFSLRWNNGCPRPCVITLKRPGFDPEPPIVIPPGPGSFNAGPRLYSEWGNVEIQSAPRQ